MNTLNVVSTPEITGNIGSCKTEISKVTTGRPNFFVTTKSDIATNSCTGGVASYNYWSFSFGGVVAVIIGLAFLLAVLGIILGRNDL